MCNRKIRRLNSFFFVTWEVKQNLECIHTIKAKTKRKLKHSLTAPNDFNAEKTYMVLEGQG